MGSAAAMNAVCARPACLPLLIPGPGALRHQRHQGRPDGYQPQGDPGRSDVCTHRALSASTGSEWRLRVHDAVT